MRGILTVPYVHFTSIQEAPKTKMSDTKTHCQSCHNVDPDTPSQVHQRHAIFTAQNPKSAEAHKASCAHLPGGNTRSVLHSLPFPLTFSSGSGPYLTDLDGHRYTDFLGEYTAGIYGHSNPVIQKAIQDVMSTGWNLGGHSRHEKQLAEIVCERFGPTMELVRFTNSGTEANMLALATARAWTGGREKVLVFEGGYHGSTLSFHKGQGQVNLPYEWVVGTYNDVPATERLVNSLPSESLAAILVEPMLDSGGAIPGTLEFLRYLRTAATQLGALLILDEVMTSRLAYRGLGDKMGVRADLMTLGKWIGGGMSFGAFGGRGDIMSLYDPAKCQLVHAGTFNNNVVSMAAGIAGCGILSKEKLDALNEKGEWMQDRMRAILQSHLYGEPPGDEVDGKREHGRERSMWVSGIGSIMAIHFAKPKLQELFFHFMLQHGMYLAPRGFIALSIEITSLDIDEFLEAAEHFVKTHLAMLRPKISQQLVPEALRTAVPRKDHTVESKDAGDEINDDKKTLILNMNDICTEEGKQNKVERGKAEHEERVEGGMQLEEDEQIGEILQIEEHKRDEKDETFVFVRRSHDPARGD